MTHDYLSKPITQMKNYGYMLNVLRTNRDEEWWVFTDRESGKQISFDINHKTVSFNGQFCLEEMRILMGVIELWQLL